MTENRDHRVASLGVTLNDGSTVVLPTRTWLDQGRVRAVMELVGVTYPGPMTADEWQAHVAERIDTAAAELTKGARR